MEKNSLVYSSVPSQLNHKIISLWVKHSENHKDITPLKFPIIRYSRDSEIRGVVNTKFLPVILQNGICQHHPVTIYMYFQ